MKKKKTKAPAETPVDVKTERGFARFQKRPLEIEAKRMDRDFTVKTLGGLMQGRKGDYLIIGIKGEPYSCAAEVFKATYKAVELPVVTDPVRIFEDYKQHE